MRVLLDENLPLKLRHHLPGHEVFTVAYLNWAGVRNGVLLKRAAEQRFDLLLTTDQGIAKQQNLARLPLAVIILVPASNDLDDVLPLVPKVLDRLRRPLGRTLTVISR